MVFRGVGASAAIVPGSLSSVATAGRMSLAEAFLNADYICLVDVSGSMTCNDSRDGKSRYDVACEELTKLQAELPGRFAVVQFSIAPEFRPGGIPSFAGGGTDLHAALKFVQPADGLVDFWVISDGEPDEISPCLQLARRMQSKVSAVYVGPRGGDGADFLRQLCAIRGGKAEESVAAADLARTIRAMIGAGATA